MAAFPFQLYKDKGEWYLDESSGCYAFDVSDGTLELEAGGAKARFFCDAIGTTPLQLPPDQPVYPRAKERLEVKSSEIMKEIQSEDNNGALFVLPSQLNGAEYTSHEKHAIVHSLEEYMRDNTGGPRGQLAVHPGAGQFIIDNAAENVKKPQGINAIDQLLQVEVIKDFLELKNGYLAIKDPKSKEIEEEVLARIDQHLHTLRPLVMEDIPASGLTPNKGRRAAELTHKVGLVYASAVPVQSYMNRGRDAGSKEFQAEIAGKILIAQYYGALQHAARSIPGGARRTVYLMPLGGGVFNNPWDKIASGMAKAMEMLDEESFAKLDVKALAWEGSRSEKDTLEKLLRP